MAKEEIVGGGVRAQEKGFSVLAELSMEMKDHDYGTLRSVLSEGWTNICGLVFFWI